MRTTQIRTGDWKSTVLMKSCKSSPTTAAGRNATTIEATNTGDRAGREVVQLYVRDVESSVPRPPRELKAFSKISLEPTPNFTGWAPTSVGTIVPWM